VVKTEADTMPGQIPDPSVTAGSLPSLGPLAGLSATTLTDQLRFGDLQEFGTMLSPLHFLDKLGKATLIIKAEVWGVKEHRKITCIANIIVVMFESWLFLPTVTQRDDDVDRRKRRREKNKMAAARCRNKKKERTDYLQMVRFQSRHHWKCFQFQHFHYKPFLCLLSGIRAIRDDELWPQVPDRGA